MPEGSGRSRRDALGLVSVAGIAGFSAQSHTASAQSRHGDPSALDAYPNPEAAGLANSDALKAMVYPLPTTSMMILRGGKVAWTYGDVRQASYLASARKSILSMLFGAAIERGQIRLDATLEQLGIDDDGDLTPLERTATVADLLTARSGVYHAAGSPGGVENGPARGSHVPGSFFFYNNWDFNVAGAVYEKATGRSIFDAFATELAAPLGLQDFDPARQRMLGYTPRRSRFLAYHFFLSCRDMAKLGQLMLDEGRWKGRRLIPQSWVKTSTAMHVPGTATNASQLGYGYLWWRLDPARSSSAFNGAFAALGNYGQYLCVFPALDLVVVHRRAVTDDFAIARNLGLTDVNPAGGEVQLLPMLDKVVQGFAS